MTTHILALGAVGAPDLVRFWTAIALLLVAARLLGILARRLGQPAVIGELSAGIVLGPTLLERVLPQASDWLFGGEVSSIMIATVSWLGVVMLLAITGFETDLGLLRRLGRAATSVSISSLVLPFATGLGLAVVLPAGFRGELGGPAFTLFMGVALSISALPVVAKVLRELGAIHGPVGQVTLAAGMVNDLVGWVLLGVVAGLAGTGEVDAAALAATIGGITLFILVACTVGQRIVDGVLRSTAERDKSDATTVGMAMVVVLVAGAITQALGVEAVLGAFVAGILLSRSPLGGRRIEHHISAVTDGFLAPIFFASAGLQVDLAAIIRPDILPWGVGIIVVATFGKVVGGLIGGRIGGMGFLESLAVGVGLNARGAVEIVVATIGLNLGVLSEVAYSVIVVMAIVTSMMAPPLLTVIGRRLESADDTPAPLTSPLLAARSVLLPTRGGGSSILAGRILDQLLTPEARLTALTVHPPELKPVRGRLAAKHVGRLINRRMSWRDRSGETASRTILDEAALGYDLIALGASAESGDSVLSGMLTDVLLAAPVPVLIVRAGLEVEPDAPINHVIASVDGSPACDVARDLAARLAVANDASLSLVHVLPLEGDLLPSSAARRAVGRSEMVGRAATDRAEGLGASPSFMLRSGSDVAQSIAEAAREGSADVVVIGTQVRSATDVAVLGSTVEDLIAQVSGTILVLAFPPSVHPDPGH